MVGGGRQHRELGAEGRVPLGGRDGGGGGGKGGGDEDGDDGYGGHTFKLIIG